MKRNLLAVLMIVFLPLAAKAAEPRATTEISPGGMTYHLLVLPKAKIVAVRVAWPTDWAYRQGVNQAVPYIGAQLVLSGGAEGYPAGKAIEKFADFGAGALLQATADYVYGWVGVKKENLEQTITIANAHLRSPKLDGKWFQRIRDGLKQKFGQFNARPAMQGYTAIRWAILGDQPIRAALSMDTPSIFDNARIADVSIWHDEVFTRMPDAVVIAGNISAVESGKIVDLLFSGLPQGGRKMQRKFTMNFAPRRILLHLPDSKISQLEFVAQVPPTSAGTIADEFSDIVIARALGIGDQSALYKALRTDMRASYAFNAGFGSYDREHRLLALTGQVKTEDLAQAEQVVGKAYKAFRKNGLGGSLKDRLAPVLAATRANRDKSNAVAMSAMSGLLDGKDAGIALQLTTNLDGITPDFVAARLTDAFPRAQDFITLAVSPNANALPGACVISRPQEAARCK